jgi:ABC-type molybdenum transport system ATPase subunit/photorepair protein PhrA/GNAT superfamily N-acetyltransferase
MPSARLVREVAVRRSPRVQQMEALFDVPPAERSRLEWDVHLPVDERPWNVGLVVGPSGSGKTTVARELFGAAAAGGFAWPEDESVLDAFPADMGVKEVVRLLGSVGFSSPPSWLRPYRALSTGEQFRVTVARTLAETAGLAVVDEFTSVIDRKVAQVASHAVQKAVRAAGRQFVAVSCHYDVIDWLNPDWVYQPQDDSFQWRCLRRRPEFRLEVRPVDRAVWRHFSRHHYLSGRLNGAALCWCGFVDGECVAFTSCVRFPHPRAKNIMMGHRLVVLPDWQGLGIGGALDDWLGLYLYQRGWRYHNTVAHPAMIHHYTRSPRWRRTHAGRSGLGGPLTSGLLSSLRRSQRHFSAVRNSQSFEYQPPAGTPTPRTTVAVRGA